MVRAVWKKIVNSKAEWTLHSTFSLNCFQLKVVFCCRFSWDEMVAYDFPTMLEYVLKTTGAKQLSYVGHSQGSLIAFTGLSRNKDLASKVSQYFKFISKYICTDYGTLTFYLKHQNGISTYGKTSFGRYLSITKWAALITQEPTQSITTPDMSSLAIEAN